jgi:hypothetical protein
VITPSKSSIVVNSETMRDVDFETSTLSLKNRRAIVVIVMFVVKFYFNLTVKSYCYLNVFNVNREFSISEVINGGELSIGCLSIIFDELVRQF